MTLTIRILAWMALAAAAGQLARGLAGGGPGTGDASGELPRGGLATESRRHGAGGEWGPSRRAGGVSPPVRGGAHDEAETTPPLWTDGFEHSGRTVEQPDGWHYLRGGRLEEDASTPEGRSCAVFRATSPGRDAEMRRLIPLAGIDAAGLTVSVAVRLADVRPGQFSGQRPAVWIDFVDERGGGLGQQRLGPWHGTADWTRHAQTVPVPPRAAGMLLRIGLFGATGEASFDAVEVRAAEVNESIFPR